jgi:valyl-tRNA synthetase
VVPFITETIWQKLPGHTEGTFLAQAAWPIARDVPGGDDDFERLREVVVGIRQIRGEYNVPPGQMIPALLVGADDLAPVLERDGALVARMARAELTIAAVAPSGSAAHVVLRAGGEVVLPLGGLVDVARERARVEEDLAQLTKQLTSLEARLANPGFTAKAPPAVIEAERAKASEWKARAAQLTAKLDALALA